MPEPHFEEAEVREIRDKDHLRGKQVVRLRGEKRWLWPLIALGILLMLFLLLRGGGEEAGGGVSLSAAERTITEASPPLRKGELLRLLVQDGFRAVPRRPRGDLELTLSLRREGVILRSSSERRLVSWDRFAERKRAP